MNFYWRGKAALAVCLGLLCVQSASAQRQREYQTVSDAAARASASFASYNSFESCGDGGCSDGSCSSGLCGGGSCGSSCGSGSGGLGLGAGLVDRPGQFFAGAEYIYARASFSEALAYVINDANDPQGGQEYVEYDFDYNSSYRFYGGYRFCDCSAEIVFNFARYRSEADFNIQDTSTLSTETILGPFEINAPDGGFLQGEADVDIQSYDIGIARTIPLGSPLCGGGSGCGDTCCGDGGCCDCGDACGSGCGCWCPAWDITWSAGARFADVSWARGQQGIFANGNIDATSRTRLNFEGAGARIGLLGRRYIGRRGLASIYAKGDLSILVGDMDIRTDTQEVANQDPLLRSHENSARRVIPVTEIEAGMTAHLGNHISLSSGYFLAAWHDLGFRDTYDYGQFQLSHYDDANILGFDGFFARAEVAY